MIFVKVIKNVFDNLRYDLRVRKHEVERRENRKKREEKRDWNLVIIFIFGKLCVLVGHI